MGFKFSIASDVREVLRNNEAMEKGFDETADSLDDLAREAQRSGDRVERALDDAGDAADGASDKIERKFRDAFREVEKHSDDASDKVRKDAKRIGDEGGESVAEFKDEARQNFGEITSSFSGDMDSIVDLAQGTFGGLAGTLTGPLGLAFGGLAATGGLFYNAWKENAEKTEQRISDMYDDMSESGSSFLSKEYLRQAINDIVTSSEDAVIGLDDVKKQAEISGVSVETLLRAWAGDQNSINEVLELTTAKQDAIRAKFDGGALDAPSSRVVGQLNDIQNGLQGVMDDTDSARAKTELYDAAIAGLPGEKGTDITANTAPGQSSIDRFLNQYLPPVTANLGLDTTDADRALLRFQTKANTTRMSTTLGVRVS